MCSSYFQFKFFFTLVFILFYVENQNINYFLEEITYVFFKNKFGHILNEYNVPSTLPIQFNFKFTQVSAGGFHSLILNNNGNVFCFGTNSVILKLVIKI